MPKESDSVQVGHQCLVHNLHLQHLYPLRRYINTVLLLLLLQYDIVLIDTTQCTRKSNGDVLHILRLCQLRQENDKHKKAFSRAVKC